MKAQKTLTLKTLTKSNVWDLQENDVLRMLDAAMSDTEMRENLAHYRNILKTAFEMEEIKVDKEAVCKKYEARGFRVYGFQIDEDTVQKLAIKKRPINRVSDLTYENIRHITAAELLAVIDRNFGGGWDSLSQSIQDIIQSGFDISTTTLPADRLKKPGGMYDKKTSDGFEALEIQKGTWVEAIFAKEKPESIKPKMKFEEENDLGDDTDAPLHTDLDDEDEQPRETDDTDDDDEMDESQLEQESYRTIVEVDEEDLQASAEDIGEEDDND